VTAQTVVLVQKRLGKKKFSLERVVCEAGLRTCEDNDDGEGDADGIINVSHDGTDDSTCA
jgi:hypothetical protein